jgi:hypothetical protein
MTDNEETGEIDETEPYELVARVVRAKLIDIGAQALDRLCARTGLSGSDIINRALLLYDEWDLVSRSGGTWAIHHRHGGVESVRVVPTAPMESTP